MPYGFFQQKPRATPNNAVSRVDESRHGRNSIRAAPQLMRTNYTSQPVDIPSTFLKQLPYDAKPITKTQIDFANSPLPAYAGMYATVLENVLSESECLQLTKLAEASAGDDGWRPALINGGAAGEAFAPDYRNSDRIIWDSPELVKRIWERCISVEGLYDDLSLIEYDELVLHPRAVERGERWVLTELNERMRFLRYGKGHFFAEHCDASYERLKPGAPERSLFTLQLYLSGDGVQGGATRFHSPRSYNNKKSAKLDVATKPGRVLIFQQRSLMHSGAEVFDGVKYTMRTDIMYKLLPMD